MRGNWMVKLCNYKDKMCYFHGFMIHKEENKALLIEIAKRGYLPRFLW